MVKFFGFTPFGNHYAFRLNVKMHPQMAHALTDFRSAFPTVRTWSLTGSNNFLQRFEGVLTADELHAFKQRLKAMKLQSRIKFLQDELDMGLPATRSGRVAHDILMEDDDDLPF